MKSTKPQILCLSRSYLSKLLPVMGQHDNQFEYLHIVQTDQEENSIKALGEKVVLNLQQVVRQGINRTQAVSWKEPADMRAVTGFNWSPIYSDRYLVHFTNDQRNRIAGAIQEAVEDLFSTHQFVAFLSEPVALFVTHLIFYHCKKNDVKPLLWCNTYFSDHFYFSDRTEISTPVRQQPLAPEKTILLQAKISEYVNGVIGDKTGPLYHHAFTGKKHKRLGYFQQRKGQSALVLRPGWASRLIQMARLSRAILYRLTFKFNGNFMTAGAVSEHKFYLRCLFANNTIYDPLPEGTIDNHVTYPLQYEPEASLLYFAPHVLNQTTFVESILKALPNQRILWVKEHPNQFGALDTPPWRALKAQYSNLRFIHGRQNGRELIKRSALVVTISSSMGMDALLLGRRLLVAGKVFYDQFTGAIRTRSYETLASELNNPNNYHIQDNSGENTQELLEFGRYAYSGDPQPSHYLYESQNVSQLVEAIHSELLPIKNSNP
jgi:hypothetical protein